MSRAMVLASHGLRWMWLIQNACKMYDSWWDFRWMPDKMRTHALTHHSNKSVRKHKYMIKHASLEQLEWLQSEHAFVPARHMIGYAIACGNSHIDVAHWLCMQTNTTWDDVTIQNNNMSHYVFRHDVPDMLPFISMSATVHFTMFKPIGVAIIFGAIKILHKLCSSNTVVTHEDYRMMCDYALRRHGANHEIYKIVHNMTRVDYIIETSCVE
jgi:hypothetical protein